MEISKFIKLVLKQLDSLFFIEEFDYEILHNEIPLVLEKCRDLFAYINDKYYFNREVNPYNSSQYATFLYFLSNFIWRKYKKVDLCDQIFYLNKTMNNVDLFYQIELPNIFYLEHPLGTILGRAKYGDFLSVSQGVTIGMNKMKTAILGEYVTMYPHSAIIGDCVIGDNVIVSIGTIIKDEDIPNNCIVFGCSPNLTIKEKTKEEIHDIVRDRWKSIIL